MSKGDIFFDALEEAFKKACKKSLSLGEQKTTMGNLSSSDMMAALNRAKSMPSSLRSLPMPKRMSLDPVKILTDSVSGNLGVVVEVMLESGAETQMIAGELLSNPVHLASIRSMGVTKTSLESFIMRRKFEVESGQVFTLTNSLNLRLYDMDIGADVPVGLIRPPFNTCYIELGEPENRESCPLECYANGNNQILEGAYVLNHDQVSLKYYSDELIQELHLDRSKPARKIEFAFTGSPVKKGESPESSVMSDLCDVISLFIQDENEPVSDVLERHFGLAEKRSAGAIKVLYGSTGVSEEFFERMRENVAHLIKCFSYIAGDNRIEEAQRTETELKEKISRVSEKKRGKIERQAEKAYDRILLGPKAKYKPLSQLIEEIEHKTGVKPHFRRGTWGVRWTEKGRTTPKLTWIKHSLVNADKIDGAEEIIKDYLVF